MSLSLNTRQQSLLVAVIRNMKADINWDQVAAESDYDTVASARDNWRHTRNKIMDAFGGDKGGAGTPTASGKKAKATPKQRKNSDDETPAKKKSKKATPPFEEDDEESKGLVKPEEDDEGDFV